MQSQTNHFKPSNLQGVWRKRFNEAEAQRVADEAEAKRVADIVFTPNKKLRREKSPSIGEQIEEHCQSMDVCDEPSDEVTVYVQTNIGSVEVNVTRKVDLENLTQELSKELKRKIPDYVHLTCNKMKLENHHVLCNGDMLAFTGHGRGGGRTRLRIEKWSIDSKGDITFGCVRDKTPVNMSPSYTGFYDVHMNQFFGLGIMKNEEDLQKFGQAFCPQEIWEPLQRKHFKTNGSRLEDKERDTLVKALKDYWKKLQKGLGDAQLDQSSEVAVIGIKAYTKLGEGNHFFYGRTKDKGEVKLPYDYEWTDEMMRTYLDGFQNIERMKQFLKAFFIEDHGFSEEAIQLATRSRIGRHKKSREQWIECAVDAWSRQNELVFHVHLYETLPIKVTAKNPKGKWEPNDLYVKYGPGPKGERTRYVVLFDEKTEAYEGLKNNLYLDLDTGKLIVTDPKEEDDEIKYELPDGGSITDIINAMARGVKEPVSLSSSSSSDSSHSMSKSSLVGSEDISNNVNRYMIAYLDKVCSVDGSNTDFKLRYHTSREIDHNTFVLDIISKDGNLPDNCLPGGLKWSKRAKPLFFQAWKAQQALLTSSKPPASPNSNTRDGAAGEEEKYDPPNDDWDRPRLLALFESENLAKVKDIEAIMAARPLGENRAFMWTELSIKYPRFFKRHPGFPAILPNTQVAKEASIEKSPTPSAMAFDGPVNSATDQYWAPGKEFDILNKSTKQPDPHDRTPNVCPGKTPPSSPGQFTMSPGSSPTGERMEFYCLNEEGMDALAPFLRRANKYEIETSPKALIIYLQDPRNVLANFRVQLVKTNPHTNNKISCLCFLGMIRKYEDQTVTQFVGDWVYEHAGPKVAEVFWNIPRHFDSDVLNEDSSASSDETFSAKPGIHKGEDETVRSAHGSPTTPLHIPDETLDRWIHNADKAADAGDPRMREAINNIADAGGRSPIYSTPQLPRQEVGVVPLPSCKSAEMEVQPVSLTAQRNNINRLEHKLKQMKMKLAEDWNAMDERAANISQAQESEVIKGQQQAKQEAATQIWAFLYGIRDRRRCQHLVDELEAAELAATIKIQAVARMRMARMQYEKNLPRWKEMQAAMKLAKRKKLEAEEADREAKRTKREAEEADRQAKRKFDEFHGV